MIRSDQLKFPRDATWTWKFTWMFGWVVYPIFFKYRIEGVENLPMKGGCVLACNHSYGIDFVLLGATAPRQVHYMTKVEAFRSNWLLARYLYGLGCFPVERNKQDIGALRTAVTKVRNGHVLGMFPEGTRSKDGQLQQGRTGTARIAIATKAPVVPAVVIGSSVIFDNYYKPGPRPEVIVRYGKPLVWNSDKKDEQASSEFTEQIMLAIAMMLPPDLRGAYREQCEQIETGSE